MTQTEALRLALEALEWQQEMLYTAMQYSAAKGMTFLGHPPNPNEAITAIKAALEAKDEPVAWRDAAIRLGEELSSVGPNGYYNMSAKEWLDWAMEQNPRGEHSLPQPVIDESAAKRIATALGWEPKRTWVGLTMKDIREIAPLWFEQEKHDCSLKEFVELIEAMVRLKNS